MSDDRKMITHSDLKPGHRKVVVYSKGDHVVIVPDTAWDMKGDLSRLPPAKQKTLVAPNKNGVRVYQRVIGSNTRSTLVPSGKKVLDESAAKGYFESTRGVSFNERQ